MKINRRDFLKTTALTSMYFAGFGVPTFAKSSHKKNLVVIMLRGGMDGLCAVPKKLLLVLRPMLEGCTSTPSPLEAPRARETHK